MQSLLSPGVLPSMGDEVLRQFVLDSDEEIEDSPSSKRDSRTNIEMTVFGDDDIIEMRVGPRHFTNGNRRAVAIKREALDMNHPNGSPRSVGERSSARGPTPANASFTFGGDHGRTGVQTTESLRTTSGAKSSLHTHQRATFTAIPSTTAPPTHGSCKSKSQAKRPVPSPATAPDATGQYESSTCHQCRTKTTRPKMICDQSLNPNCLVRICRPCLMDRKAYDEMPKLRGPLFKFVPGGKILCMKCRNICPCASCRRARGERGVMGNGLNGFYDLMRDEPKTEAPLRKTKRKEREQAKPKQSPGHPIVDKCKNEQKGAEVVCLEESWDELVGKSNRTIISGKNGKTTGQSHARSNRIGSRASCGLRKSPDPVWIAGCSRKRKFCAKQFTDEESDCCIPVDGPTIPAPKKEKPGFRSKDPEDVRQDRLERQLDSQIRELELRRAREELERNNATADAFTKAKMIQQFLRCGLNLEDALRATNECLCLPTQSPARR
ncbi:uncharacterized protein PGTG_00992 [Puccinia graminis f. sp. tritici CRL 75-36-700-3]|uniref:Zinc-finger domain-containing protein n=1 Tax=Puccinia graminis f. sp. tritici (strain CRL 75-36-700-3 / race SCCL) TaxID=418459 RepID=E3JUD6_PUCGT|nr:uncharacterized protein PGTG_00992 [Puccinia graminis f. sp. tritici CRL 75-36-700-3]EFP75661.1 hypothetical protein PGTG_00992 [Puccinia graminis f. sp. tritici CRL 75-36-700-3]